MIKINWGKIVNLALYLIVSGIFIFLFVFIVDRGLSRQERVICEGLKKQSEEYELFFLTLNQKEMCDIYQIYINAEVK